MTVDPLSLPRVTPSKLGHQARARRRPDRNGMPDRANPYRRAEDAPLLRTIVEAAWRDYEAELIPAGWKERVAGILLEDLDRRFPPADMAVLEAYGLAGVQRMFRVLDGRSMHLIDMPAQRYLPYRREPGMNVAPATFAVGSAQLHVDVPEAAMPYFEALRVAAAERAEQYDRAISWVSWEIHGHKRQPTWGDIEDAFPRLGAWMARMRED